MNHKVLGVAADDMNIQYYGRLMCVLRGSMRSTHAKVWALFSHRDRGLMLSNVNDHKHKHSLIDSD